MTTIINGSSPSITFSDGSAQTSATRPFQNRIINGDMTIAQRGTSALSVDSAATYYPVDRFGFYGSVASSKFTAQQSSTAPAGFSKSLLLTSSSAYSVAAGDFFYGMQGIEGFNTADLNWGTANAKTITISFWVRSSVTGNFGAVLRNLVAAADRGYPFLYNIAAANTWEQKSITIAGDTSGTWLTDNGCGMAICFSVGSGSTWNGTPNAWATGNFIGATGQTNIVATNGATFYITGVQLEVGSTATSFDYRPYGTELALCQRYFVKFAKELNYCPLIPVLAYNTTDAYAIFAFPIRMRTSPTGTFSVASDFLLTGNGAESAATSMGFNVSSTYSAEVNFARSVVQGYSYWVRYTATGGADNSKFIAFSAEL